MLTVPTPARAVSANDDDPGKPLKRVIRFVREPVPVPKGLIFATAALVTWLCLPAETQQIDTADKTKNIAGERLRESKDDFDASDGIVSFDGRTWYRQGKPTRKNFRFLEATCANENENDIRLLELIGRENEGVYERILVEQLNHDGEWVNHGQSIAWLLDGKLDESMYVLGKLQGAQRVWHANGQLKLHRQYAYGEDDGIERSWYDSGQLQYDIVTVNGEEIRTRLWHWDGTPY